MLQSHLNAKLLKKNVDFPVFCLCSGVISLKLVKYCVCVFQEHSISVLFVFLLGFSKLFKISVYPVDGAAYVPFVNGEGNIYVSWTSVCQTWGVFESTDCL